MRKYPLLLAGLALFACDDSPVDPTDKGVIVVTPGTAVTIGASGGILATADETVSLTVPAGAVSTDVPITISAVGASVPGVAEWTEAVELGPDGRTFDEPLTLSLAVSPDALPSGVPASALRIYTFEDGGWKEVPGSTATGDYVVSAQIEHFSAYAVQIAPNAATAPPRGLELGAGESATYGPVTFEYRSASGEVYPAAHQIVSWESSAPTVLELGETESVTDADGQTTSPQVEAQSSGTGVLTATVGDAEISIDFIVSNELGTYVLQTIGGKTLPTLGTGELVKSITIVLEEGGKCSFSGEARGDQENPNGVFESWAADACTYTLDGTDLALRVESADEDFEVTGQLLGNKIILPMEVMDDNVDADPGYTADAVFVKE